MDDRNNNHLQEVVFITNNFPCADGETAGCLSQHLASYLASLALCLQCILLSIVSLEEGWGGGLKI